MNIHLKLTDGVEKTISIHYMCIVLIEFQKHVYLHLTSLRKLSVFRSSPMNIRIIFDPVIDLNNHEGLLYFVIIRNVKEFLDMCLAKCLPIYIWPGQAARFIQTYFLK